MCERCGEGEDVILQMKITPLGLQTWMGSLCTFALGKKTFSAHRCLVLEREPSAHQLSQWVLEISTRRLKETGCLCTTSSSAETREPPSLTLRHFTHHRGLHLWHQWGHQWGRMHPRVISFLQERQGWRDVALTLKDNGQYYCYEGRASWVLNRDGQTTFCLIANPVGAPRPRSQGETSSQGWITRHCICSCSQRWETLAGATYVRAAAEEVWQGHDVGCILLSRVTWKGNKKDNKEKDNKTQKPLFSSLYQTFQEGLMSVCRFTVPQAHGVVKGAVDVSWKFLYYCACLWHLTLCYGSSQTVVCGPPVVSKPMASDLQIICPRPPLFSSESLNIRLHGDLEGCW